MKLMNVLAYLSIVLAGVCKTAGVSTKNDVSSCRISACGP